MIGLETIIIDSDEDKHLNQSDHYGLQLILHFRIRSLSKQSAVVLLPPMNRWSIIDSYRKKYDSEYPQWPPHIKLLYPFYDLNNGDDDEENILLQLRLLLSQCKSFNIEINEIDSLDHNHITFMKLNQQSIEQLKQLYENLQQIFPKDLFKIEDNYNPYIKIAQFDSKKRQDQVKPLLSKS